MSKAQKIAIWCTVISGLFAIAAAVVPDLLPFAHEPKSSITIQGVVMRDDADPLKRAPIQGVQVTDQNGLATQPVTTDESGMFNLQLTPQAKTGDRICLQFVRSDYQLKTMNNAIGDVLYNAYLWPATYTAGLRKESAPLIAVAYSPVNTLNATFQIANQGNVRCNNRQPCSPDGKWKASIVSKSLDAGQGNVFINAHAACIAGPCPFTKIEKSPMAGERSISVTVRNWSDTATYRLWGDVKRQ